MRIQIASDLHLQFWANRGRSLEDLINEMRPSDPADVDVLVLAGDITELTPQMFDHARRIFETFARCWKRVLYVPGNHEFYDTSIDEGLYQLMEIEEKFKETSFDFRVLRTGRVVEIEGQRFLGSTMWQPKPTGDDAAGVRPISDHYCIKDFYKEAPRQFADWKAFLEKELRRNDIVVTHHTPSYQSCAERFEGSSVNWWFHTPQVEPLIKERMPRLWIHGHTHSSFDYYLDSDTRVICNPRGYPGEMDVNFKPQLIVEI